MSLVLGDLKKLHEKGLALIYLRPKTKRPFEKAWTKETPKSWEELENSFEPSYNVGVRLGAASKLPSGNYLGAIDCDVKAMSRQAKQEMNDALRKLGIDLNSAPIVMSGRGNGSKHVYVQTREPLRPGRYASSQHKVKVLMPGETREPSRDELTKLTPEEIKQGYRIRPAWEISFMGTGQQTVLPPSTHPDTGMKYAWASPLMVKFLPLFCDEKFRASRKQITQTPGEVTETFKAVDVDLWSTSLPVRFIHMIESGEGVVDRSADLLAVTMSMCRHGFDDNQILSVLSNENHWLSGAALERRQGDRLSAVEWLKQYVLEPARHETSILRRFDNPPELKPLSKKEKAITQEKVMADIDETLPDLDGKGKPQNTLKNVVHILEKFLEGELVGLNEFSGRPYFRKDTPYGGIRGKELADHDDINLKYYIATHYRFEPSKELCFEAHSFVARKHRWHPVRQYLEKLQWDGTPRLDSWLREALNASGPEAYLMAISRKVLVAAVARIYDPGCKFDYVMVLEGNQGEGKSTTLQILASAPWFTDGLGDIHNKDVVDQMTGKWIIELGELASIRKSETETIKAFLSRQIDRVRMSYGRRSEDYPRQSIFVGSTNSSEYFTDETGNRRFWPVRVGVADRDWLKRNREQLWAEAVMRYELGETIYMNQELETIAAKEQEKRFDVDDWEAEIRKIIFKSPEGPFITTELWRAINLGDAGLHPSQYDQKRIGKIMHRLGYKRGNVRIDKVQTKCWRFKRKEK